MDVPCRNGPAGVAHGSVFDRNAVNVGHLGTDIYHDGALTVKHC